MAFHALQGAIALAVVLVALIMPSVSALPNLRILPLGDSITKGSGSTGIVGYRGPLREKLTKEGISVDMIGTLKDGNMEDDNHEGHSGKYLAQINGWWQKPVNARPNVVLIHAGTNNMDKEVDLDIAIDLMTEIVDGIFKAAPDVTICLAPVIWANNPAMQANTDRFNPQVRNLIKDRQSAGKHILEVPTDITVSDLSDLKHPNNQGYEKMANAWLKAIKEADSRGWLKTPVKMSPSDAPGTGLGIDGANEGEAPVNVWRKEGTIFDGFRTWEEVGTISGPLKEAGRVILADLNGDGISDYIVADDDGTVRAWLYEGKPTLWKSLGKVNPDWDTIKGDMIRLADVDNDGKADLIALFSDGAARVWKNTKDGAKFESLDSKWATGLASREKVHFEDVDGDGYVDYVVIDSDGSVKWARNTHNNGKDSNKKNWEDAETIAPGPAGIPNNRARLRDLDGDGKADYLVVYDGGAVKAWRNSGRLNSGPGTNWHDLGTIAPGISGVTGDMVQFADMDGDGLADFLAVAKDGSIRMWKNRGIVSVKGKSLRLADINGDGKADIISVDARGRARAWVNNNGKFDDIGEIAPGFNNNMTSARIEFEDVDGDGLADYLIIYGGGAVKAYLNNGNIGNMGSPNVGSGKESRIWKEGITISPGVGEPGSKVRFADLDGDGTADYLILYDGGAVKAWLNRGNIGKNNGERLWKDGYTVATGVGEPGEKIRFADLTGDKRAEYIVQYDGGAAKGYRNTGNIPRAGKDRNWNLMGTVAAGVTPQGPVHYADINGDGKADYLVVFDGGAINAYVNKYDWDKQLPGEGGNNGEDDDGEDDNNPEGPVGFTPSLETFFNFVSGDSKNEPFGATGSVLRPPVRMQKWIALGDSYAAGPGAGNTVEDDMPDCQRGEAAYPYQMQRDESLPGPDGALGERPEFTFKACTGDKTTQMLDRANPNYQLAPISEFTNVATLSIGGNDVGFAKILKPCLYLEFAGPSCDEAIAEARKRMYGPDFGPRYFKVLQEIVDRMAWKRRDNQYTAIFQTGYSQFFDDYTTQCNQVGFLYWGAGIRVTQELRAKLNQLTHELNYVLQYWIALFNTRNTRDRNRWELPTTPVHFVNVDLFYNGHRFCREGVQEPDFRNTNTHFFHLLAAHQEKVEQNEATNYTKDEVEAMVEKYYAQEPVTATMPIDVVKAFHPTPRGFRDTSMTVISKFQYQMAARQFALRGGRFNLMVLGDYVAYASQDPNSNIYQGFIPHLQAVFRNRAFYGSPSIPGFSISPDFIGSRQPQSYNGQPHECWQTATLERLGDELKKSANLGTQGKVVILMAGTIDVLYNIDFDKAEERMNRILQILIQNDEEVSILLVQIPLVGAAEDADGTTWYELQRRIVSFNAMLAGLANIYLTRGWGKVLLVHASATPLEHNDGDLILPSADGYRRIAHDLAEALVYAKAYGWLESSQNSPPTTTPKRDSLPAPGSIKRGVEGGILICNDRDKFSKKQPSKEDIRDSFLQGLKIDDFIEKIACNRTELCKISQDGLHGDPLQPSMLSFNATVCQRTGGKPGNPNLLNTQVRMPSPDYELAKSECSGIIKDIIDYCVMENNAIGGAWRPADEHPKRERDLHIIMQGSNLDQVQIDSRSYEADFLDQGAVRQLLQSNVALSRP